MSKAYPKKYKLINRSPYKMRPLEHCPKCKTHFSKKKVKVIFKDVVECLYCGLIWIIISEEDLIKWFK